jgi:soluble epoxide hydrolase/lipid-phosphate phosphatase
MIYLTFPQYIPAAGPFTPIANIVIGLPALAYQVFFEDETPAAVVELDNNITRTIRATLRTVDSPPPADFLKSNDSFMSAWKGVEVVCVI